MKMKKTIATLGIAAVTAGAASFLLSPAIAVSVLALPFLYGGGKKLYDFGKKVVKSASTTPTTQQTTTKPSQATTSSTVTRPQVAVAAGKVKINAAKEGAQQPPIKQEEKPKAEQATIMQEKQEKIVSVEPQQNTLLLSDDYEKKFSELRSIAYEQATGKGLRTNIKWLYDSFQEVLPLWEMRNKNLPGAPGSGRNRKALEDELFDSFAKDASKPLTYYELETLRDRLWEVTVPMAENQVQRARR